MNKSPNNTEFRDRSIKKYLKEVIKPLLPNASIGSVFSMGAADRPFGSATIELSKRNNVLFRSPYYYQNELKFIHYTSIKSLISIIKERAIRMYDLNNMSDPLELSYSISEINKINIEKWKEMVFSFSMCDYKDSEAEQDLVNWRYYGNDGNGLAIILSFDKKTQPYWYGYHLSKVYYGNKYKEENIDLLINRYKLFQNETGFYIHDFYKDFILSLSAFHKVGIYESENEVRFLNIIKKSDYKLHERKNIEIDLSKFNKRVSYSKMRIDKKDFLEEIKYNKYKDFLKRMFPIPKIEGIILGYKFNNNDRYEIENVINSITNEYLDYTINVKISELKKYFDN